MTGENIFWLLFFIAFGLIEAHYWFIYFPRAWRDGSNPEINDIRLVCDTLRRRHTGGGQ